MGMIGGILDLLIALVIGSPLDRKKDASPSPVSDTHQQEHPNEPTKNTPGTKTSGEPEIQLEEHTTF